MRSEVWTSILLLIYSIVSTAANAQAVQSYKFVGSVMQTYGSTLIVSDGKRTLEFDASRLSEIPAVGDEITIRYELDAIESDLRRRPSQEPDQVAPSRDKRRRTRGIPGEKKDLILDDRAFYDA